MKENYRKNVAAIIVNKDKKILMCEHAWIDNAWQFPQGGVEEGEKDSEAIIRELKEEIGTDKFKIIKELDENIKYKFPFYLKEKYKFDGQTQKFFLLYFEGKDNDIRFDNQEKPEFKAFEWVNYEEPPIRVIYFKKLSYLKALTQFKEEYDKL